MKFLGGGTEVGLGLFPLCDPRVSVYLIVYCTQALVSPFILDDLLDDTEDDCLDRSCGDEQPGCKFELEGDGSAISYDRLKEIDSDAANRIHPNDHRKVNQYLRLYARSGVLPSKIFQGKVSEVQFSPCSVASLKIATCSFLYSCQLLSPLKFSFTNYAITLVDNVLILNAAGQKWGRADSFRYDCCFICVDASLPVLDKYVEQRVDCMMDAGLLTEVYEIYSRNADYTRGLRQAIGVREFEDFLRFHLSETEPFQPSVKDSTMPKKKAEILKDNLSTILDTSDSKHKILLDEAIDKLKTNTRRLVRRQKRRFNRLQALFGWNLHYVDATETLLGTSHGSWLKQVIEPSTQIIKSFLYDNTSLLPYSVELNDVERQKVVSRHLWTQFMCKACGNRILRGAHEWEQHQQGRGHRKRVQSLIKSKQFLLNSSPAPEPVSDFKTTAP
ncbi:hypothetical protein GIB67_023172 [Kingdonia uniflora]|uniref:Uncharacterized protein n=1 Tax=Kingdonia uniflora TaxID=39325 RepID=A0A7J7MCL0_9MAGN|nr:hypothetical protein GIB67_023172 [Kingdonia uniflora]